MLHGIDGYFTERTRFERRVSGVTAAVGVTFLSLMLLAQLPTVRRAMRPLTGPMRFGYEGRDQFVRRILLESSGRAANTRTLQRAPDLRQALKGGRHPDADSKSPRARPVSRRDLPVGPGESEADLLSRARRLHRDAEVVQSQDLVIEKLVRPDYPPEAQDHGLEGRVALVAKVDTTGRVVQVEVLGTSGERQFERAATEAVWQCLFRPYKVDGETKEVFAVFRFNFRLSD